MPLQIAITNGPGQGLVFSLEKEPVTLGRDTRVEIYLDDPRASRRHAVVEPCDDGSWVLRDLGSTNLTFLNGRSVSSATLKEGDVITIGGCELAVQANAPGDRIPPAPEIAVAMDPLSLQAGLRQAGERRAGGKLLQEALFQLGLLADPALGPGTYVRRAVPIVAEGISFTLWAWLEWPEGLERPYRAVGERRSEPVTEKDIDLSRSLIDRAFHRRQGVISADLGGTFEQSVCLRRDQALSALAVPLTARSGTDSLLYLERDATLLPFSKEDLEWVATLASQLAVGIENIALYRSLKSAYERLRESQSQLSRSEKMAVIGRLASGFAHDLNNPLSSLLGFLELARRTLPAPPPEGFPEKLPAFLERAQATADFCRALCRNRLAFARQRPFTEGDVTPFKVSKTVENTLNICDAALRRSGVEITTRIPAEIELSGDSSTLQQMVMNLLVNACDALAESKSPGEGRIEIVVEPDDDGIRLQVTDNGPGIPEQVAARIFEPLFTTKGDAQGTGLGLHVVQRIVEEVGGSIRFTTEVGRGTSFILHLPRRLVRLTSEEIHPMTLVHISPPIEELT
ncbi:MAG: ATP-binding protein [Planctomycetota bacterium]